MTVIDGVEIDDITYNLKNIKRTLRHGTPIDDKLHVIMVVSNPCQFQSRYRLAREFIQRMEDPDEDANADDQRSVAFGRDAEKTSVCEDCRSSTPDVVLYIVELIYGTTQTYMVTDPENPRHLQLHAEHPLWHKENMINLGIQRLLPPDWKAVAWIDADLEFDSAEWAKNTLKLLNHDFDIVQLFSHCIDMGPIGETMNVFSSAGFQYQKGSKYRFYGSGRDYWHPGYAWACTRGAYDKMQGLYETSILGSADNIMFLSIMGYGLKSIHRNSTEEYKRSVKEFQERVHGFRFGYVPGLIRHHFHGHKKNRQYIERWKILMDHRYDPYTYVVRDPSTGVLVPNMEKCPKEMLDQIVEYFVSRKEDE
jgi:hypothetical protein